MTEQTDDEGLREAQIEEVYSTPPRETGYVKWFNDLKKYGFIRREDGSDVFVHATSINHDPPRLKEHDRVEFTVIPGEKGPAARDVVILARATD